MNTWEYIVKTLDGMMDPLERPVYNRLRIEYDDGGGYWVEWFKDEDEDRHYRIHIPRAKKNLTWARALTIGHEIGHVIWSELESWSVYQRFLAEWMEEIKKHRVWCWILRVYHWNRMLRMIRRWFGFSADIKYDPNDQMPDSKYTRGDNELFCDWFALKVKQWPGIQVKPRAGQTIVGSWQSIDEGTAQQQAMNSDALITPVDQVKKFKESFPDKRIYSDLAIACLEEPEGSTIYIWPGRYQNGEEEQ